MLRFNYFDLLDVVLIELLMKIFIILKTDNRIVSYSMKYKKNKNKVIKRLKLLYNFFFFKVS